GYTVEEESTWGQLSFQVMFDQVLPEELARAAADGWGGDAYRIDWDGSEVALALVYRGDTEADAAEMAEALASYAPAAMAVGAGEPDDSGTSFRGDSYAFVSRAGDQVTLVAASDPARGEELREALVPAAAP
ncbi:MAG: hypothetical protein ACRDVM_08835, partial [Acidimicrobiia bacterium]